MSVITIESDAFKIIIKKLNLIEQYIKSTTTTKSKWISEDEVMMLTGLKKRTLREKRSKGEFTYSTATGRKIKYLRKEIEDYLNDNSTR